jgi:ferritin-like metal-binding protein YciE
LKETEEHVTRLEKYLNLWVSKQLPRNAMQWRDYLKRLKELSKTKVGDVRDAAMISAAQK